MTKRPDPFDRSVDLPRRDLKAIFPYLDRPEFRSRTKWEQARQIDVALHRLAAASRMQ